MSNATTTAKQNFFMDYAYPIIVGVLIVVITGLGIIFREEIKKRLFLRKIGDVIEPLLEKYKTEILSEENIETPKTVAVLSDKDISEREEVPFGYIFVPMENEELIKPILISNIPLSSTFKKIRILFDETLRKSLFRFLSYKLALESQEMELAARIRDLSLRDESQANDFEIIEKLYNEEKLVGIILNEARIRLRKTQDNPTVSDVREFSRFVRKISELDVMLVRIGRVLDSTVYEKINVCKKNKRGIILLARGKNVERAIKLSEDLIGDIDAQQRISYEKYSSSVLEFSNPETGTWYFHDNQVPYIRIWLTPIKWRQLDHAWIKVS